MLIINMFQSLLIHAHTIIYDINYHILTFHISMDFKKSFTVLILQSMIDRILHDRLQYKTNDRNMGNTRFHLYLKLQLILITHFLDGKITSHIFNFLPDRNELILITDALPEQSCKRSCHNYHFFILLSLSHPYNRIQCIIQKMWINLRLKCFQFYFSFLFLLLYILFHQLTDPVGHHIK